MVDRLAEHIEKGYWWLVGFLGTLTLTSITLRARKDSEIKKEFGVVHGRITDLERTVGQNYPSNHDFKMMCDNMNRQIDSLSNTMNGRFDSLEEDVREIRNGQKKR